VVTAFSPDVHHCAELQRTRPVAILPGVSDVPLRTLQTPPERENAPEAARKAVFEVEYKSSSFNCSKSNGWNFNAILKTVDLFDTPWTPCR